MQEVVYYLDSKLMGFVCFSVKTRSGRTWTNNSKNTSTNGVNRGPRRKMSSSVSKRSRLSARYCTILT